MAKKYAPNVIKLLNFLERFMPSQKEIEKTLSQGSIRSRCILLINDFAEKRLNPDKIKGVPSGFLTSEEAKAIIKSVRSNHEIDIYTDLRQLEKNLGNFLNFAKQLKFALLQLCSEAESIMWRMAHQKEFKRIAAALLGFIPAENKKSAMEQAKPTLDFQAKELQEENLQLLRKKLLVATINLKTALQAGRDYMKEKKVTMAIYKVLFAAIEKEAESTAEHPSIYEDFALYPNYSQAPIDTNLYQIITEYHFHD